MGWISGLWQAVKRFFKRSRSVREKQVNEAPKSSSFTPPGMANLSYGGALDGTSPETMAKHLAQMPMNRAQRRRVSALERARLKHDKFVKPKGPEPLPYESREPAPAPTLKLPAGPVAEVPAAESGVKDADLVIADHYWNDPEGEKVLYKEQEFLGEFYFRDTILDQLERYFFYLARMKRRDPGSYGFYRELGATLIPYSLSKWLDDDDEDDGYSKFDILKHAQLSEWFNKTRPAFGCVAYGTDPYTEGKEKQFTTSLKRAYYRPKFLYFRKYQVPPPTVQPMHGGDVYGMTLWWDRPGITKRGGYPQEYWVHVSKDGKRIRLLKELDFHGGYWRSWQIPPTYQRCAKKYHVSAELFLAACFCDAARYCEYPNYAMLRVSVANDEDMHAVFNLEVKRTPYFFKDRDIQLNDRGHRKRILHIVRPHVRKDGTIVPMHFAGIKKFDWAGYHVNITIAGRDHCMIQEFDYGVLGDKTKYKDTITEPEAGKLFAKWIKTGEGAWRGA